VGSTGTKPTPGFAFLHHPTGAIVTATEDRSQHVNREVAWRRLEQHLAAASAIRTHEVVNETRRDTLGDSRAWTWCGWRDEVRGPGGRHASMQRVLAGRLGLIL